MKWHPHKSQWTIFTALERYDRRRAAESQAWITKVEVTWWGAFWRGAWTVFTAALIPGIVAVVWKLLFG